MLNDLLVLELASVLAGPSVGQWLAELGATVLKIEHFTNGGDVTRTWKLPTEAPEDDRPAYFTSVNWGKQSIGLNLRHEDGQALLHQLVEKADVLIASFKPGDAPKLAADPETLRRINPQLIYADISAYGPEDNRTGFDAIIQAEAGFTYMNGNPESGPVKMPVALMDILAAHHLREAILLALLRRQSSGEGAHVSTALIAAGISSLANQAANYLVGQRIPQALGSDHPNIVPYGTIYQSRDGCDIVLAVGNDRQFESLCKALGIAEIAEDSRFAKNAVRVQHRVPLNEILRTSIAQYDREPLLQTFRTEKVPAGAVYDMAEALSQPAAQPLLLQGPTLTGLRTAAFSGLPTAHHLSEPPHLGQHTQTALATHLEMKDADIAVLVKNGVIGIYSA